MMTVGTMAAMISPIVMALGQPFIMLVPSLLAAINFLASFWLSKPGEYLPAAVEVNENVTWLRMENANQVINDSI